MELTVLKHSRMETILDNGEDEPPGLKYSYLYGMFHLCVPLELSTAASQGSTNYK